MNKPISPPVAEDVGPLDEHGQQIWSPGEAAAIARLDDDAAYWASIAEARAQVDRGDCFTTDEVRSHMAEVKREWRAERDRH
ncbi:MAG TPA: hypothetical protein VF638_08050 [Sphingomonas sp.]